MKRTDLSFLRRAFFINAAILFFACGISVPKAGPASLMEVRADCRDKSGRDNGRADDIIRELRGITGIKIVAIESVPASFIILKINQPRAKAFGIDQDRIIQWITVDINLLVISRNYDSITFEYDDALTDISGLAQMPIYPHDGPSVPLSAIAEIRVERNDTRRPYTPGDRFIFVRIETDPDGFARTGEILNRRFGRIPGITWKTVTTE
jgi:multidrug efflux pump subunit AcrB